MILRLSSLLWSAALLPLCGQEEVLPLAPTEEQKKAEEKENKDASFRIPLGAIISDVSLPYYGKNKHQVSLLTAKQMTVEGADPDLDPDLDPSQLQRLNGENLTLLLFDKSGEISSTTTIPKAQYHVGEQQLVTSGQLIMRSADDSFATRSNGAIFTLKTGQALFLGPGVTRYTLPKRSKTTMNLSPLLPFSAAMQMLIAAPPEIDPAHLETFERLVAPRLAPHLDADEQFAKAELNNAALAQRVAEYLLKVGKTELLTQVADPLPAPKPDPLDALFKNGPSDMSIDFDKGAYLDSEALEIAYFGNITIKAQGIKMTCNKDLKVIFNQPPPKEKKTGKTDPKKENGPLKNFTGFGDLKQVTANGKIRIEGVSKGKKFFLGGDRALFESNPLNPKEDGTITIRGDKLAFISGDPYDKDSEEPLIQSSSTTKDAWAIVKIEPSADPSKSNLTVQFSKGNWSMSVRDRTKK